MTTKTKQLLPLQPLLWHLLIEPLPPQETTSGGIVIPTDTKEAEKIMITVGKVVAMGSLSFTGKTSSGVSLADEVEKPQIGDHVLFQRYTGQAVILRDGRRFIVLQDSEVLAKVSDPSQLRFHI